MITDAQWKTLEPMLLGRPGSPGATSNNNRLFIDAVIYRFSKISTWTELPLRYGNWSTIYMRFKRWSENGFWHQLIEKIKHDLELHALFKKILFYVNRISCRLVKKNTSEYAIGYHVFKGSAIKIIDDSLIDKNSTLHWLNLI